MILKRTHLLLFWVLLLLVLLWGARPAMLPVEAGAIYSPLVISEMMASNGEGLLDEDGDYSDWIELHNRGHRPLNLGNYALSDDPRRPEKWPFPDRTLAGDAYLIIFASDKDRRPTDPEQPLHTNFKLKRGGEYLALYSRREQAVVDAFTPHYPEQLRFISYSYYSNYSRNRDYRWNEKEETFVYTPLGTPGTPNKLDSTWRGLINRVEPSVSRGFFDTPFSVTLNTPSTGATIRYTLDGSPPSETNGLLYQGPILISQTTTLRAAAFQPDYLPSPISTHSYLFIDDILNQPTLDPQLQADTSYAAQVKEALQEIPSLSLVTADDGYYIYAHAWQKGREWERPASIELLDPTRKQTGFQVDAGIRMNGKGGRSLPKIAFRFFFRGIYGPAKLDYPLFPDSPVTSFETLILRSGGNRNYTNFRMAVPFLKNATYTRDAWFRQSQIDMAGLGARGVFVHLYLNGTYWGLYELVERPDAAFAATHLGDSEEDWYARKPDGSLSGGKDRFHELTDLVAEDGLDNPAVYAQVQHYLDIPQFIDYVLLHWYAGAQDWPHSNWFMVMPNPTGQARYFAWDGEETWTGAGADVHLGGDNPSFIADLFQALLQNDDFKLTLADRLHHHLSPGGALSDAQAQQRWLAVNQPLEQAIWAEIARWGALRRDRAEPEGWLQEPDRFLAQIGTATNPWLHRTPNTVSLTYDDWLAAGKRVQTQMIGNGGRLITLMRANGYYPALDPPAFSQPGGPVEPGERIALAAGEGQLYVTADGSDPRQPITGEIAPQAALYQTPLVITQTTHLKARLWRNQTWSALSEATFQVNPPARQLAITELMVNPPGGSDYEFIELGNISREPVSLGNLTFKGVRYTFPSGASLEGGRSLVLVRNPVAFAERYPAVEIGGVYGGKLSNQGEQLVLKDVAGQVILSMRYDEANGWPVSAAGLGDSLEVIDPTADLNDPHNWQASFTLYGTPGR